PGAFQPALASVYGNAFVTKMSADGRSLNYSTYLGGSGNTTEEEGDSAQAIAIDSTGNAYITGQAFSGNFPTLNPFQSLLGSAFGDAFLAKLNPAGSNLVFSTYLGGSGNANLRTGDSGYAIALDATGNAYVSGSTTSDDFPVVTPFQGQLKGPENA